MSGIRANQSDRRSIKTELERNEGEQSELSRDEQTRVSK